MVQKFPLSYVPAESTLYPSLLQIVADPPKQLAFDNDLVPHACAGVLAPTMRTTSAEAARTALATFGELDCLNFTCDSLHPYAVGKTTKVTG